MTYVARFAEFCLLFVRWTRACWSYADLAPVLVLFFELFIGYKCLFRRKLLSRPVHNLFIFLSREFSSLQGFKLVPVLFPRDCFIFTPRIQFALEQLRVRKLVRIIRELVVPLGLWLALFACVRLG